MAFIAANPGRIRPDSGSVYADEGTLAHEYAERILKGTMDEKDLPEQFAPVLEYTSRCKTLINRWGGEVYVEAKLPLFYLPSETGTTDFALVCSWGIFIRDLKYGAGQFVEVEENDQLAIYAMNIVQDLDVTHGFDDDTKISIGVVQPRFAGEEVERTWETTVGGLKTFCEGIRKAAEVNLAALADPEYAAKFTKFSPSYDTCIWCKAGRSSACTAKTKAINALKPDLLDGFDSSDDAAIELELVNELANVSTVSDQQILAIIKHKRLIKSIIDAAEEVANRRAISGNPIPGTKLVEGKLGNREWTDEHKAEETLARLFPGVQRYKKSLHTPTQIIKEIKTATVSKDTLAEIEKLISRAPGKPICAMIDDPRPAIECPITGFDDETTEEDV